jgi:hypothetical protein
MSKLIIQDETADAPPPGLPARLPVGEQMLWQGQPAWWPLAIHAFHVRKVAIYFAFLCAARIVYAMGDGDSFLRASRFILVFAPFAAAAMGILSLLAWRYARTTIYTITSKRVIIQSGIALDVTVNLPFSRIDAVGLRVHRDGTGDLPLRLTKEDRIAVLAIWPNMRPWRITRPEPMLRSVPEPTIVAKLLGSALAGKAVVPHQPSQVRAEASTAGGLSPAI